MADNDNLLGETPEVWTGNEEKKGAPILDMDDLGGLLGEEPQVWSGSEQKKGAPVLEEQVVLDEPTQTWTENKLGAPVLDEAPVLDDPGSYVPQEKKGDLQLEGNMDDILGGGDPAAYDPVAEFVQKLQFDDALTEKFKTLDAEQQQQIVAMRSQQLGIPAPMIPNELRPKVQEALPEAADIALEETPKTEEYVPSFKDEDLERIKAESKKPQKYVPPPVEMTEEKRKENIRIMNELREEREREQARKGFKQLIILTVVGVLGALAFGFFFSDTFGNGYKQEFGWLGTVESVATILGVLMGISALVLAAPVPQLKGITKFFFVVGFLLSLVPGIPLLIQKDGSGAISGLLLAISAICCLATVVVMSTSDGIDAYNKHGLH